MSAATKAKSARARATIARNLYVRNRSGEFGRNLDDCFEMNDGDEVVRILNEMVKTDRSFREAIIQHSDSAPPAVLSVAREFDAKPIAYQLGYTTAIEATDERSINYRPGFEPEQYAKTIRNCFSNSEVQIPDFVAGAKAALAERTVQQCK